MQEGIGLLQGRTNPKQPIFSEQFVNNSFVVSSSEDDIVVFGLSKKWPEELVCWWYFEKGHGYCNMGGK